MCRVLWITEATATRSAATVPVTMSRCSSAPPEIFSLLDRSLANEVIDVVDGIFFSCELFPALSQGLLELSCFLPFFYCSFSVRSTPLSGLY